MGFPEVSNMKPPGDVLYPFGGFLDLILIIKTDAGPKEFLGDEGVLR